MFCNFTNTYGRPPVSCTSLPQWLTTLVGALENANPVRCQEDVVGPTLLTIEALWGACTPPNGAMVIWYDSVAAETTYWVYSNGVWTEAVLA